MGLLKNFRFKISITAARLYLNREKKIRKDILLRFFTEKCNLLDDILDGLLSIALSKGLIVKRPKILLVKEGVGERIKQSRDGEIIAVFQTLALAIEGDLILVFFKTYQDIGEMELGVLIAHELGHVVDFQTKRKGHPLFSSIKYSYKEVFANAVASYLLTKLVVVVALKKLEANFDEAKLVRLYLDAPDV